MPETENSKLQEALPKIAPGSLRVVALGGLHEVGKNMWVYETLSEEGESEYIVVDAGIVYPGYEHPGVDYVMPEFDYLIDKEDKIKALVLTSVHESHMGCTVPLIQKCGIKKVIGSKLALELAKIRLEDEKDKIEWVEFEARVPVSVGAFNVLPFAMTSSSAESYGVSVEAASNKVFYTGTYKIDQTLKGYQKMDLSALTAYSTPDEEEGKEIDLYIADSANVELEGYSGSEMTIHRKLKEIFSKEKGRIIFNSCNSNTIRFQTAFTVAEELGRKVALLNKDMKQVYEAAANTGLITHKKDTLLTIRDISNFKDDELLILSSAPEGDALKEIVALANDEDLEFQLKEGDTIINSADAPPGTIRVMAQACDQFFLKKVKIIGGRNAGIHVQGHAMTEEMKFMFNLTRPKYFLPAIGETRHIVRHAKLAMDTGFDPARIFMLDNGDVIDVSQANGIKVVGKVKTGETLFNHHQESDIDDQIVKERAVLSKEGIVTIGFTLNKNKKIVAGPVFSAKACTFSKNKEWRAFCIMNTQDIVDSVNQLSIENPKAEVSDYQELIREHMVGIIKNQIGKKPSVCVMVNQI